MLSLEPNECRVLGVLVEKAQTTPQQYPLTLNALVNGANQKNNRDPVTNLSEQEVLDAIDGLRSKGLAREVMLSGSRVEKFRHVAREVLEIDTNQLVILTELLLRGPQTLGELRGRASRMSPSGTLDSIEIVKNVLDSLVSRGEPLVRELPPALGDRAPRYVQLLCPSLHPLDAPAASPRATQFAEVQNTSAMPSRHDPDLVRRVAQLEADVTHLRDAVHKLADALGEPHSATAAD